ncbi:diacylglycerol kinase family protein [Gordonia sp. OPL2]|uniref:diacylglycerol/lipid kinase family protein n=1 Tax=Gordonia sp. OPL2 TaxID=2486274 RepID=UPI0016552712|nr:diacylglycerol kinase family protein [Gordonia sp. OPL2]ROZ93798.1 diacylglycerol kinase [Gordonia sp. OPL2]
MAAHDETAVTPGGNPLSQTNRERTGAGSRPTPGRRLSAIIALAAIASCAVLILLFLIHSGVHIVLGLAGVALAGAGAWWMVTEAGRRRIGGTIAVVLGFVIVATSLALALSGADTVVIRLGAMVILMGVASAGTRYALVPELHELDRERRTHHPRRPVLICNPRSGDGKVERFGLVSAAHEMGVETVVLEPGDDLEKLARDAIARGADCLGMAGGDGSQALVASVAVEHDVPFVCVSAGTRNHFALDLGLHRDDPRTTLRAFGDAVERRVDHATVNGRLFVNNVSLGVYATIVQQESYRGEKTQTAAAMLPELIGPDSTPFDLQFTTPSGTDVDGAYLIMVSNNPYATTASLDAVTRPRLDTGTLGVIAVSATTAAEAARLTARSALGLRRSSPYWHEFATDAVEIRSRSGTALVGVDGEAGEMPTPLRFRSHPGGLRLLVPADNHAVTALRRARGVHMRALLDVARGRRPDV